MCQKLAVISVDAIKNHSLTSNTLARAQQSDDYLSVIREALSSEDNKLFPRFEIKNQVLYKSIYEKSLTTKKLVICIPDVLLPSVIHTLHVQLGHASLTATIINFQHFYYHRNASRIIKSYCKSCVTCALATKHDIKKTLPSTERSLQPTRPRQYIYCDLIPMYPGSLSYILFCLDAYSQFIYAIPLKDKTAASILQAFLSLFASTGWPEAVYLDNETSFTKASKLLVKMAPVRILFSTPYCQFQNWSENYIKNFKKTFLKMLNDSENPQNNEDWPLLLPTVTQALNRQIIPILGLSREAIHFNLSSEFHPLAQASAQAADDINPITTEDVNLFQTVMDNRRKLRATVKKPKPPLFHQTQIVFMKDQAPSTSNILKIPNKGPYRIDELAERNVKLTDLSTGKPVHSHVQNIRPLGLDEFKLMLNNKWDLNTQHQKANLPASAPSVFDQPDSPYSTQEIVKIEADQNLVKKEEPENLSLQQLFNESDSIQPTPIMKTVEKEPPNEPPDLTLSKDQTQNQSLNQAQPKANEPLLHNQPTVRRSERIRSKLSSHWFTDSDSENESDNETNLLFNSLHIQSDTNQKTSKRLKLRPKRRVSFYLTNFPPFMYPPESKSDSDSD
jgi:hypothetical protein